MENYSTIPKLVKLRSRGQLTIPQEMREALQIDERTGLNILQVGKVLIMTPRRLERVSLAKEVEKELKKEGLSLEDLISDLTAQRKRYVAEPFQKD
jgi:bifunctional DNA-binding transcriptional regulator/antitoxin component of YhaV-PrlF toxin-antitoxin module